MSDTNETMGAEMAAPTKRAAILRRLGEIQELHRSGALGGETMPEDARPPLDRGSLELYHYLTLPMALNYQRNSYALWRAATLTFLDPDTRDVFDPLLVAEMGLERLRTGLVKHRVALQPR